MAEFKKNDARAVSERYGLLKAMNTIVMDCNDEGVYMSWIYIIPDQCEDDELMEIAMDCPETYKEACELFGRLMRSSMVKEGGFYVGGEVFG